MADVAKILIVDDDPNFAKQIAKELRVAGHSCAVELRGERAVEQVRKHSPDLLLLDVMLSGVSGFQICREIRGDSSLTKIPILIVSAMNSDEEVRHGLAQGADDYVTKPFRMGALLQRIDALLKASAGEGFIDEVTTLPNTQGTRRDLQRRLTTSLPFALVYIELTELRQVSIPSGDEGRSKILRHLSRALKDYGNGKENGAYHVGHMGGGHFMATLPTDEIFPFCESMQQSWEPHLMELCASLNATRKTGSELNLLFFATVREQSELLTPMEMMEVVSRLRRKHGNEYTSSVHLDQRHGA